MSVTVVTRVCVCVLFIQFTQTAMLLNQERDATILPRNVDKLAVNQAV
jgi:hypothetical protein